MKPAAPLTELARIVQTALAEDLGERGDITTEAIVPPGSRLEAVIRSREPGRVAGTDVIALTLAQFGEPVSALVATPDGTDVGRGDVVANLDGSARTLLSA